MAKRRSTEQQLADAEARLDRLRDQVRKEDTRRRIIVGSMMLSLAERDDALLDFLKRRLDERLSERDRRLFREHLGIAIPGLYGATLHLHPVEQQPGWAFDRELQPAAQLDRYGNPLNA